MPSNICLMCNNATNFPIFGLCPECAEWADQQCDERDFPQTFDDQCREYARNHGELNPTQAWFNTPFDTWEPNPHYTGPAVLHPEMDIPDECADLECITHTEDTHDDLPF